MNEANQPLTFHIGDCFSASADRNDARLYIYRLCDECDLSHEEAITNRHVTKPIDDCFSTLRQIAMMQLWSMIVKPARCHAELVEAWVVAFDV